MPNDCIKLEDGSGGIEMDELVSLIREYLFETGEWQNSDGDSANIIFPSNNQLVFTTDSFVIDPIFFPGGDIGELSMCGTINDLAVCGADPLGVALAFIIEEGFLKDDFIKILKSISKISKKTGVPIATGDTKVSEKGSIDKIAITTSGAGYAKSIISDAGLNHGDKIIASGELFSHGAAILAHRFNYKSSLKSDSHPILAQMQAVRKYLTAAKDPTRGGIAMVLNEMAEKSAVQIVIEENKIPLKSEVRALTEMLGIDLYALPSEGRFVAGVKAENADKVVKILREFNPNACVIGEARKAPQKKHELFSSVVLEGEFSRRSLEKPTGKLLPRIC